MIRILLENVLLFLLPTLLYLLYVVVQRRTAGGSGAQGQAGLLDDAPLLWLFLAGALTVIVTLAAFGSNTGGKPSEVYVPPTLQDGRIVPGHQARPAPEAPPRTDREPGTAGAQH